MSEKRQRSRVGKPKKKKKPNKDTEWFRRKVAELKTELEKLPVDRREQLQRELEEEEPGKPEE